MREAPAPGTGSTPADWTASQLVCDVLERVPGDAVRRTACAPGRLDIMGGSAEYSGSLVLNTTVSDRVCVAVQQRNDGRVSITTAYCDDLDGTKPIVFEQARLRDAAGHCLSCQQGHELLGGAGNDTARRVVGALVGLLSGRIVPDLGGGLSIVVGSTMDGLGDLGQDAALGAGVLAATAQAMSVELDALHAAEALAALEPGWFDVPIATVDVVGVLAGQVRALTQIRGRPCSLVGSLALPDDLVLVGIDCGASHPQMSAKYEQVRTSSFMGRALIDRILRHEGWPHPQWDGHLAQVSCADFVERFRDRIPTKIKGREFLDRFGETGDPLTRIDPDVVYKIRSRTEHHIYEHDRAHQFVECLSRAIRNRDTQALWQTGKLMYASHWSYGQRCGLGSIETDLLVNLLRRHDTDAGIYGAKITGHGCGGVVAVLMQASKQAAAAVDQAVQDYQAQTGRKATLISGSAPGVLAAGVRSL